MQVAHILLRIQQHAGASFPPRNTLAGLFMSLSVGSGQHSAVATVYSHRAQHRRHSAAPS
jgi:hypothetical protein